MFPLKSCEFVQKGWFCIFLISPSFWKACQMPNAGVIAATTSLTPRGSHILQLSAVFTALMRRVTNVLTTMKLAFMLLEIQWGLCLLKWELLLRFLPPSLRSSLPPSLLLLSQPMAGNKLKSSLRNECIWCTVRLCYICIINHLFFFNFHGMLVLFIAQKETWEEYQVL